jgi:TetR/AcrR family transcriptional repressor of nem operon
MKTYQLVCFSRLISAFSYDPVKAKDTIRLDNRARSAKILLQDIPNGILDSHDTYTLGQGWLHDPEKTRKQILDAAFREIYHRGFQGVSVNEIVSKTDVTKGAFFHYFPTKNDLGYAIIDEILKEMILERWIRPLAAYQNPVQGIITRFRKLIECTSDDSAKFGCPLNNLTQEMSSVDPVFREKLQEVIKLWIDETERYLKIAQERGYLSEKASPREVAEFIVMVQEGSFGMVKNLRDKKVYWSLFNSLRQYLESLSEKPEMLVAKHSR